VARSLYERGYSSRVQLQLVDDLQLKDLYLRLCREANWGFKYLPALSRRAAANSRKGFDGSKTLT
jgi:hypothetical protein